jgi:hypothetical protein
VAFGATIVMAGLFAVMLAERVWIVTFLPPPNAPVFFEEPDPWSLIEGIASGDTQNLLGVAFMIWLFCRMVRRVLR